MTVVLIARGIDLSVGSVMGLSAGVAAYFINQGLIFPLALLAGIAWRRLLRVSECPDDHQAGPARFRGHPRDARRRSGGALPVDGGRPSPGT